MTTALRAPSRGARSIAWAAVGTLLAATAGLHTGAAAASTPTLAANATVQVVEIGAAGSGVPANSRRR